MIDTKYADEAISFGQAVVTHHFLNEVPVTNKKWQNAQPYDRAGARSRSPQKEVVSQMSSLQRPSTATQSKVVQFDMVDESQRQTFAHKKHETNEFKTIKEALTWADPQVEEVDKNHRPNSRWITEQKDKFRTFIPGSEILHG